MLQLTKTGIKTQSAEEILTEIRQRFINIFGSNVNLDPNSINGQLITEFVNLILENDLKYLEMFNNFNIDYATGVWLDAIGKLFLINRIQGTSSEAQIMITGLTGLIIPIEFEISDGVNIWYAPQEYTVDNINTMRFLSREKGEIAASAGAITQVLTPLNGIESITNPSPAVLGTKEETDFALRKRIKNLQALNSTSQILSLESELATISENFIVLENFTGEQSTIDGAVIDAHSIFVCIQGGSDKQIAQALFNKKSLGCGMTGTTSYTLKLPHGQEFIAKFTRPTLMPIKIKMSIKNVATQPFNFIKLATTTILNLFNALAKVGVNLYSSEFIQAVANAGVSDILAASLALKSDNIDKLNIDFNATQFPTLSEEDIEITAT